MKNKTLWAHKNFDADKAEAFCNDYKNFLSTCKTERECTAEIINELKKAGARSVDELIASGKTPKANDLVYADMMKKSVLIFRIGKQPLTEGFRILGAHIDSPRLDLKQKPLYEDKGLAYFDTHYYGGIKKYQWTALPLAIHGVVAKKDGSSVVINIGEKPEDPVFGISDLLPHLGAKQMAKKASEFIPGESLNILIGSKPAADDSDKESKKEKEPVKKYILSILKEQYGIEEEDFISAELEVVPAGGAKDFGLDRSMIISYGQDDRVCAYPSFRAIMDQENPEITSVCLLTDKEEIGSVGATGMHSRFFEDTIAEVMDICGCYSEIKLRRALKKSCVLSSDVTAGFDPMYPDVSEPNNSAYLGLGPVFNKYTGSRGKSGSNDANAEYIAFLRNIMDSENVSYQTSELGKVDEGGGGTIAYIMANLGMNVIDFGVAVLSMHAPFEITSKADVYETYRAYRAFVSK
jgi:aspartyl aminopeptidase